MSLFAALCLAGCAQTSDFGRIRPTAWSEALVATAEPVVVLASTELVSDVRITDDERELRHRARHFLVPAHERSWLAHHLRTSLPPVADPWDKTAYHLALISGPFRSPASRYSRLAADADADMLLLDPFAALAGRVIATDRIRLQSLPHMHDLTEHDVIGAKARVADNLCLIASVRDEIAPRTEAYRYALEHLFLELPQSEAVQAERALRRLENHRSALDALPIHSHPDRPCGIVGEEPYAPPGPASPRRLIVKG